MTDRYCIDCRHMRIGATCAKKQWRDPVTGILKDKYCDVRRDNPYDECGPDAKEWEAKEHQS